MPRLLTVSRAARLVGVPRSTLQKKIQDGELTSFEGQVDIDELTRAYPQAQVEDNAMLDKIEKIIETALQRARGDKIRKLLTPDLGTLAVRVAALSKELARIKSNADHYAGLLQHIHEQLPLILEDKDIHGSLTKLKDWFDAEINLSQQQAGDNQLLAQDTLLRVMAAQVHIMPSGHDFFVEGNNSILEAALSAGLAINYGCSNGNCGKCKSRLISGEVRKIKNHDYVMSDEDKQKGCILTCSNTAVTDIVLAATEALDESDIPLQNISAKIRKLDHLSNDLAVLHLRTPRTQRLRFLAGQRASLSGKDIPATELPIASCPCDDRNLQFHIVRNSEDPFAEYIFKQARNNEDIDVEGPIGHFVLQAEQSSLPIVFIAFDTGFAPIKSLIEHAMTLNAVEYIHLLWVASEPNGHYQHNICRAWTDAFDNFRYTGASINDINSSTEVKSQLKKFLRKYPDINDFQFYVAGSDRNIKTCIDFFETRGLNQTQLFTETL